MVPRAPSPVLIFALLDSFWAVLMASGPIFMFCATRIILDGTKDVRSSFALPDYF
jgi:hypothetical protein